MKLYERLAFVVVAAVLFVFQIAEAKNNLYDITNTIIDQLINPLIWFGLVIATLVFLWGVVQFIIANGSGDEEGFNTGKKHLVWGLIGLFIMLSAKGILAVIQKFFECAKIGGC